MERALTREHISARARRYFSALIRSYCLGLFLGLLIANLDAMQTALQDVVFTV